MAGPAIDGHDGSPDRTGRIGRLIGFAGMPPVFAPALFLGFAEWTRTDALRADAANRSRAVRRGGLRRRCGSTPTKTPEEV
jgi:hypothetical protein